MCSFIFKLFEKTANCNYRKTCCVVREHCCAVSMDTCFQLLDVQKRPEIKSSKGSENS